MLRTAQNQIHELEQNQFRVAGNEACATCHSWSMSSCGDLPRRQSTSSVSFPPLQPSSLPSRVARLRASAGLTEAQGQLGTPLCRMALVKVGLLSGDKRWNPTDAPPALSPKIVTCVMKAAVSMFLLLHTRDLHGPIKSFVPQQILLSHSCPKKLLQHNNNNDNNNNVVTRLRKPFFKNILLLNTLI